jgi:hypothetical protein
MKRESQELLELELFVVKTKLPPFSSHSKPARARLAHSKAKRRYSGAAP